MRRFSRILQYVGLILPPVSIILQLQGTVSLSIMLVLLLAAVSAFWLGRIVEGYVTR